MTDDFTPGPWFAFEADFQLPEDEGPVFVIGPEEFHTVAQVRPGSRDDGLPTQTPANALLMAAAPELLRAAVEARDFLVQHGKEPGRTVFWDLVAAIEKAVAPSQNPEDDARPIRVSGGSQTISTRAEARKDHEVQMTTEHRAHPRDLSVACYINGWTYWHFKSALPLETVRDPKFFYWLHDMLAVGDKLFVTCWDGAGDFIVTNLENKMVRTKILSFVTWGED